MGVVYEALHVQTQGRYALKLLGPAARSPEALRRFQRECEALAQLRHPHVVKIHTADLSGPAPYMVQDLLSGGTLRDRLDRGGPLPWEEALEITRKLAEGLAAAHAAGVLHRDVKTENVLFDEHGEPVLCDFGLARRIEGARSLTKTGVLVGTPSCMAPEQAAGKPVDARTDVYGLGVLLYTLLTGQGPFDDRPSLMELLSAIARTPPTPPSKLHEGVPPAVDGVCLQALAKAPADRYASVESLVGGLKTAALRPNRRPAWRRSRAQSLGAVVGVGLIGGLGFAGWFAGSSEPSRRGASSPSPLSTTSLREEVVEALEAGEGDRAWTLLARAPEDPSWKRLRGLAALLRGKLNAARTFLGSGRAVRAACRAEAARSSRADRPAKLEQVDLELLPEQLVFAQEATSIEHVGALLARRHQEDALRRVLAVDLASLGFQQQGDHAMEELVMRCLKLARRLAPDSDDECLLQALQREWKWEGRWRKFRRESARQGMQLPPEFPATRLAEDEATAQRIALSRVRVGGRSSARRALIWALRASLGRRSPPSSSSATPPSEEVLRRYDELKNGSSFEKDLLARELAAWSSSSLPAALFAAWRERDRSAAVRLLGLASRSALIRRSEGLASVLEVAGLARVGAAGPPVRRSEVSRLEFMRLSRRSPFEVKAQADATIRKLSSGAPGSGSNVLRQLAAAHCVRALVHADAEDRAAAGLDLAKARRLLEQDFAEASPGADSPVEWKGAPRDAPWLVPGYVARVLAGEIRYPAFLRQAYAESEFRAEEAVSPEPETR
jgi:hypothetical protein